MTRAKDHMLVGAFPILYRDRYGSPQRTNMVWGFSVNDGWFKIIYALSEKIEAWNRNHPLEGPVVATQVKEKFGTLHFYVSPHVEEVMGWIEEAMNKSAETCENCGDPGELRDSRAWLKTLCNPCNLKWSKKT